MIRALSTAATGLEAQQAKIANIANDLANVNTDAYKKSVTEFQDLMYETVKEPGGALGASSQTPVGIQYGMGVKVGAAHKIFEQGPARMTYHPYDLMIEGQGFFPLLTAQGEPAYSRNGAFRVDAQGVVQLANGSKLVPQIIVPNTSQSITVSRTGEFRAMLPGGAEVVLGQLQLVNFPNAQGLLASGEGMYKASLASGTPIQALPGESGLGTVLQGAQEGSNVNVASSMVDMITSQRAYELGAKMMGIADQMLNATVNIK